MNELTAKQLFFAGGPLMIPIVLCGITAAIIIFKKWLFLKNARINAANIKSKTFALIRQNKIKAAILLCEKDYSPLASVLVAGLVRFGLPRDEIKEAIDTATSLEIPKLEEGLIPLITLANVAPLFGIFGTTVGMTIIFQKMQSANLSLHVITSADIAGGIWQALLTTLAGLFVAIPSFVAYNYFLNLVNILINDINRSAQQLVLVLAQLNDSKEHQNSQLNE